MTIETRPFDPAAYLDSPEAILAYLEGAFSEGDAGEIADALGVVARARHVQTRRGHRLDPAVSLQGVEQRWESGVRHRP